MKANLVKVTTTSGFDGVEIEEYLEPITAHVVVGMNFFKDFFSGFTDFFGGRSETYQRVLSSIDEEVINELRKKAFALGGNCILSLKIDNDEISAKDKSMMMVTAIGTAAKARFSIQEKVSSKEVTTLDFEEFCYLKKKKDFIIASTTNNLSIDREFWNFIKANRIDELIPFVIEKFSKWINSGQYLEHTITELSKDVEEYLQVLDYQTVIDYLYSRFLGENSVDVNLRLLSLLNNLHLVDFNKAISNLSSQEFRIQKSALQLLSVHKYAYTIEDIQSIKTAIDIINTIFNERGSRSMKKKVLSLKEKEVWICECNKENDIDQIYCTSCNKDIYGFTNDELRPEKVKSKLEIELEILQESLT